jgi:uncharacterized protein
MPSRHDPRRFDLADAAAHDVVGEGRWPLAELRRLADDHPADAPPLAGEVTWRAQAYRRAVAGAAPEVWLHLTAHAQVVRSCQRCLQPLPLRLEVDRRLRFVVGEDAAAALDADSDDDVLELQPRLDLRDLVEDELLLALPLVPRHELCREPLPRSAGELPEDEHPFAALAALKPGGPGH